MTETLGNNSAEQIKSIVERIISLEEEKAGLSSDVRDVYTEAKSNGFDPAALRIVVKEKMADADKKRKAEEREAVADTYRLALGMIL